MIGHGCCSCLPSALRRKDSVLIHTLIATPLAAPRGILRATKSLLGIFYYHDPYFMTASADDVAAD